MKTLRLLTLLSFALLSSGCFDVLNEIWVNNDGTGRIRTKIMFDDKESTESYVPVLKRSMELATYNLQNNYNVKTYKINEFRADGKHGVALDVFLKRIDKINMVADDMFSAQGYSVQTSYVSQQNNKGQFIMTISGNEQKGSWTDFVFVDRYFTTILYANKIISSNGWDSADRKSVSWKVELIRMIQPSYKTQFKAVVEQ